MTASMNLVISALIPATKTNHDIPQSHVPHVPPTPWLSHTVATYATPRAARTTSQEARLSQIPLRSPHPSAESSTSFRFMGMGEESLNRFSNDLSDMFRNSSGPLGSRFPPFVPARAQVPFLSLPTVLHPLQRLVPSRCGSRERRIAVASIIPVDWTCARPPHRLGLGRPLGFPPVPTTRISLPMERARNPGSTDMGPGSPFREGRRGGS